MQLWSKIWGKINQESLFDNESQRTVVLLRCVYLVLIVYYTIFFALMSFYSQAEEGIFRISWIAIVSICATVWLFCLSYRQRIRRNLILFIAMELLWLIGFIAVFGWGCGAQQIMFVLMVLVYFSFYDALPQKAIFTAGLFLLRFILFVYSQKYGAYAELQGRLLIILQVWSSLSFFTLMGIICGFFSSNIEIADKNLVLYNQRLREQASTDPLTGVWNRRRMRAYLADNIRQYPQMPFSLGMGDIDLFKRVNDTYGHDCGDAVLKWLTELLQKAMEGKGRLCRWGGEEFLLYFPEMNGDEATKLLIDFLLMLRKTPFLWKEEEIHISMTFGVGEFDFHSELDVLIKQADEKLYIGKNKGRNQVVF
ncbi:MAG: GGDEF domain-containing protein [Lachnospiraceae bacterium]|nr:GGDEF domain-containing protein [Lachnospiraceae bacterium]